MANQNEETAEKNCPFCAERILAAARKCKHCSEWLDLSPIEDSATTQPQQPKDTEDPDQDEYLEYYNPFNAMPPWSIESLEDISDTNEPQQPDDQSNDTAPPSTKRLKGRLLILGAIGALAPLAFISGGAMKDITGGGIIKDVTNAVTKAVTKPRWTGTFHTEYGWSMTFKKETITLNTDQGRSICKATSYDEPSVSHNASFNDGSNFSRSTIFNCPTIAPMNGQVTLSWFRGDDPKHDIWISILDSEPYTRYTHYRGAPPKRQQATQTQTGPQLEPGRRACTRSGAEQRVFAYVTSNRNIPQPAFTERDLGPYKIEYLGFHPNNGTYGFHIADLQASRSGECILIDVVLDRR